MTCAWTARVWQEFRAGNLTRAARDCLLTLRTYRGRGGSIHPSHATLAERVDCHASTVWRALQAARDLGLVSWAERRVRAAWRSLRTSNQYWLTQPEGAVAQRLQPSRGVCRRTSMQGARGGENNQKKAARENSKGVLATMLAEAATLPDLLKARRDAWAAGLVRT